MNQSAIAASLLAIAAAGVATAAHAQTVYPTRNIRIIVPFLPGGATDILARLLSARFHAAWGQVAVVENRGGGAGLIGAEQVVKAAPDGHTLLMSTASLTVNVTLFPKMPFNLQRDLTPITQVASAPIVIVVHPSVPARTLPELIKLAKSRKEVMAFGSNGTGTTSHLGGEYLQQLAGVKFTHVPYKGASGAMIAAVSGETDIGMPAVTSGRPHIATGKLRGLAVTTKRKSSVLPDLPTVDSMYPGFDIDNWFSLWAPAGTPASVIRQLHAEAVKSLQHPDMKNFFQREGAEPVGSTGEELAAHIAREIEKYGKIIKTANIRPDA
jgi:tripartite-type tricarboxylate transporter receptor subunit TctC